MQEIRQELDRRWGKGEKLLFGEPWSAAGTAVRPGTRLAGKESLKRLDRETGAFCDATRDAVKGPIEVGRETEPGFVNGGGLDTGILTHCVRGWAGAEGPFSVKAPSQTITYLSSHDDWTLWDKLVLTGWTRLSCRPTGWRRPSALPVRGGCFCCTASGRRQSCCRCRRASGSCWRTGSPASGGSRRRCIPAPPPWPP